MGDQPLALASAGIRARLLAVPVRSYMHSALAAADVRASKAFAGAKTQGLEARSFIVPDGTNEFVS
jgi:hypothetical protein